MGLDELVDDVEESKKKEELQNLADKLGIEDREDMEELDQRLDRMLAIVLTLERDVEELKKEVRLHQKALHRLAQGGGEEGKEEDQGQPWQ